MSKFDIGDRVIIKSRKRMGIGTIIAKSLFQGEILFTVSFPPSISRFDVTEKSLKGIDRRIKFVW